MNTQQSIYAPLLDKTFETAISGFISAVTYDDIRKRADSFLHKESRKSGIARMLREADDQGGTLAETDVSLILSCSNMTIYKNITEYERENNVVLPRRGTVHDLGRSTTHKRIILENRSGIKRLRRTSHGKLITLTSNHFWEHI